MKKNPSFTRLAIIAAAAVVAATEVQPMMWFIGYY